MESTILKWAERNKFVIVLFITILGLMALLYSAYFTLGHWLIKEAYYDRSLAFLNRVIQGQEAHPLSFYIGIADRYFLVFVVSLAFLCLLVWLVFTFRNTVIALLAKYDTASSAFFYGLITVVMTFPLVLKITTHIGGIGGDSWQNIWNLWWMKKALIELKTSPYYTDYIYHPSGVSLAYHTISPFNSLLAVPLQEVLSLITTFNLLVFLSFVGSAFSMYLLVKYLLGSHSAAFVSGLIFAFNPYRLSRLYFGNLQCLGTMFIPLYVLFLIKWFRDRNWRDALLSSVFFSLTSLSDWYYGAFLAIFTLVYVLYRGAKDLGKIARSQLAKQAVVFLATILIMLSPFIYPMISQLSDFSEYQYYRQSQESSADLLGFLVPDNTVKSTFVRVLSRIGISSPRAFISRTYSLFHGNPFEKTVFIGYTVIFLALVGSRKFAKEAVFWIIAAFSFFVLSLGPRLYVLGKGYVLLPYQIVSHIPLMSFMRGPSRMTIMTMMSLAVLAGYGCKALLERTGKHKRLLMVSMGALVLAEYLAAPFPTTDTRFVPYFYKRIAREPGSFAILDIPSDFWGASGPGGLYMYYQTTHGKKIIGGYVSREPRYVFGTLEKFDLIRKLTPDYYKSRLFDFALTDKEKTFLAKKGQRELIKLGVKYVVLHKSFLAEEAQREVHSLFVGMLGAPVYSGNGLVAFRVR